MHLRISSFFRSNRRAETPCWHGSSGQLDVECLEGRLPLSAAPVDVDAGSSVAFPESSIVREFDNNSSCNCNRIAEWAEAAQQENQVYYVSERGSDGNSGLIRQQPLQTIGAALRLVEPGDTVLVMPGVYREEFYNPPGGTDWEHPVRIAAFDADDRPILRPPVGAFRVFSFASAASSYIESDGFVMNAINVQYEAVKITWGTGLGGSHHVRIKNSIIKNSKTTGILVNGHNHGVRHNEVINLNVHHNGTTDFDHGVYVSAPWTVVKGSRVHHNAGWGLHSWSGDASHSVFRDNTIFANAAAGDRGEGIGIYNGQNIKVLDNIIARNRHGIGIGGDVIGAEITGNKIRRNDVAFVIRQPSVIDTLVRQNVLDGNVQNDFRDEGTDTVFSGNRQK